MQDPRESFLRRLFRGMLARSWWVVGIYAVLLAIAVPYALKVHQDNAIDRLIVKDDPDFIATEAFGKVFGGGEYVVLFAEAEKPFDPEVVQAVDALDRKLQKLEHVTPQSVLSIYRRAHPDSDPVRDLPEFEKFARGTPLFTKQGLVGPTFFGMPLILDVHSTEERTAVLGAIEATVADLVANPAPLIALRRVGQPYVNEYLNVKTTEGGMRLIPVFGLFVVVLVIGLYRSWRALFAFVIAMLVNVALAVGWIGVTGGNFSIVSALVPMTILITCLATLVYIHSRYVERPPEIGIEDHHVFALSNKFLACTASVLATAVGFAALEVSHIQPIRELGRWVAVGLLFTWLISFTLFPALQRLMNIPTQVERKTAAQWFQRVVDWLPHFSYRWRWVTVTLSVVLSAAGAVALFGAPGGAIQPMAMLTDPINYVNAESDLYKDTRRVEKLMPGLSMGEVWLQGKVGSLNQPEVIKGLDDFQKAMEAEKDANGDPLIGSAVGPTMVLRMLRYIGGHGDQLPEDPDELESLTDTLESLLKQDALLSRFVDPKDMAQTHFTIVTRINDYPTHVALGERIQAIWKDTADRHPALSKEFAEGPKMVGLGLLQSKVGHGLVPTLTESFLLTVIIIFSVFLFIFRNGAARLMAMIPSIFAILVMFLIMRIFGIELSVTTILVATTVLGTSENDQIHFFYHFLEGKAGGGTTETGLRHTTLIAGRSIFFATLINTVGFLAFILSDLPPIRQFAILSAIAFPLSMIADFTALPGALWMVFRDKPDSLRKLVPALAKRGNGVPEDAPAAAPHDHPLA